MDFLLELHKGLSWVLYLVPAKDVYGKYRDLFPLEARRSLGNPCLCHPQGTCATLLDNSSWFSKGCHLGLLQHHPR